MAIAKVTLIGLLNWDSKLFDPLTLPDGIDKETFKNTLLLRGGDFPVIYPNADFMKIAIKAWGDKMEATFSRWVQTLTEDYNPLHNYDRYENWNDGEETTASNTSTTDVSGYDSEELKTNHKTSDSGSGKRNGTHTGHLYGNIGVTTSAEMAAQEINLRAAYNLYDLMTEAFIHEFCIEVY